MQKFSPSHTSLIRSESNTFFLLPNSCYQLMMPYRALTAARLADTVLLHHYYRRDQCAADNAAVGCKHTHQDQYG
jgi:hypothetical protein